MAEADGAAEYIGSIRAQFAVSSDGTAGYSVPIVVPPGIAGMQPHLALGYGTGAGNGLLGIGWNVRGLSAITRAGQTLAQDGTITPLSYGPSDRFTLDGQRLMLVEGADYDAPDAVFHTEVESWQKIVPVYATPTPGRSGSDSFIVHSADGKKLEYGATADARVTASLTNPTIRLWALNKVVDENGNALTISYELDAANGMNYPVAIDYTANEVQQVEPRRHLRFSYVKRPDVFTHYQAGYPVVLDRLLSAVETYLDSRLVRCYELSYVVGAATGRSRLLTVKEVDAAGKSLPATRFDWQDAAAGIFAATSPPAITDQAPVGIHRPMDVNGDGRTDIVNAYQVGGFLQVTLFISNGTGFSAPIKLPRTAIPYGSATQLIPLDVDGDGRIDLVCAGQNGTSLGLTLLRFHEDAGNWRVETGPLYGAGPQDLPPGGTLMAMDIDGDGLVDLLYAHSAGTAMKLVPLYSDGQSRFVRSADDNTHCTAPYAPGAHWLPLDLDGDGRSDLVYAYASGTDYTFVLFRSAGRNGLQQQSGSPLPEGVTVVASGTLLATDINGDGHADIVHASLDNSGPDSRVLLQTLLSNGKGFVAAPPQAIALPGRQVGSLRLLPGDYNGDGLTDLAIAIGQGSTIQLAVLMATASGFTLAQEVTQPDAGLPSTAGILPLDYQGSGLTALLFIYANGGRTALATMPSAGPYPDLLTGITEGLGGKFDITYLPMTDPAVYSRSNEAPIGQMDPRGLLSGSVSGAIATLRPGTSSSLGTGVVPASRVLDFPKYVVRHHRKDFVRGGAAPGEYTYAYAGARLDLRGRGWLGFAEMVVDNPVCGTRMVTRYHQDFPLTFATKESITRRDGDNALMFDITYVHVAKEATANPGSGVHVTQMVGITRKFYTFAAGPDPVPDAIEERAIGYDAFGNPNSIASTGSALAAPLYSFATYDNDPVGWRLGRRTEYKRCADAAGSMIFDWRRFEYYGATGNLSGERYWNDQTKEMERLVYTVDGFGHRTGVTNAAGATTLTTFDDAYHSFAVAAVSPANPSGIQLRWERSYDAAFGTVLTETDSNGVVTTHLVDGLGRTVGIDGPMPNGDGAPLNRQRCGSDSVGPYIETETLVDWAGATRWSRDYLDGFGRIFKSVALGPDGRTPVVKDMRLDPLGRVVRQSLPSYDSGTTTLFEETRYDAYGRIIAVDTPRGEDTVTTTYNWTAINQMVETRAAGRPGQRVITSHYRMAADRTQPVSRAFGSEAPTVFAYDEIGRLTATTDPAGITTGTTYDSLGRRISIYRQVKTGPSRELARFVYQVAPGVMTMTETDTAGVVTRAAYDALGRMVRRAVTGSDGRTTETTFVYDDPAAPYGKGHVTSVQGPDAQYRYGYDATGNTTHLEIVLGSDHFAFEKSFAPGGRRQTMKFPDGSVQNATYNAVGMLSEIGFRPSGAAVQPIASYDEYTSFGRPGRIAYSNDVVAKVDYDATGLLRSCAAAGPGGQLYSRCYAWNDFGGISEATEGTSVSRFAYDAAGRLSEAALASGTERFAYDAAGNITEKDGIAFANEEYRPISGSRGGEAVFAASYDTNGNMVQRTANGVATRFRYDAENRLVEAGNVTFAYDHNGRRVRKHTAGARTVLYPVPSYEVVRGDDGGTQHSIYIKDGLGLTAVWTKANSGTIVSGKGVPQPGLYFIDRDHINSVRLQTDETGIAATRIHYRPFGEPLVEGLDTIARKFTGAQWDEELALYYLGARYYDPSLGRFITGDTQPGGPLNQPDVLNAYAYCLNDPINRFDPTGHAAYSGWNPAEQVTNFFTQTVPDWILKHKGQVVSTIVDGALLVGGLAAFALSPLAGPLAPLVGALGATLVGAGISGANYQLTQIISGGDFDFGEWGIQLGIGAAAGAVTGVGIGLGALGADFAAGRFVSSAVAQGLKAGTWGRSALNVVVSAAANAAGGSLGEILNSVDPNHRDAWYAGAGSAALSGAVFGGLGAAAAEAVFLKTTSRALRSAQSRRPPQSYQLWQEDDEGKAQAAKLVQDKRFEIAQALNRSPVFNAVYALPGVFFVTVDTAFEDALHLYLTW